MPQITVDRLQVVEALQEVPPEQLEWMIAAGKARQIAAGEILFNMDAALDKTYFLLEGKVRLGLIQKKNFKEAAIMEPGAVMGFLPFSRGKTAVVNAECIKDCLVLEVPADEIRKAIRLHFELTEALVHVMTNRVRMYTTQQQQIEKMAALGKLSAGLAHELNNPVASIIRNAAFLLDKLDHFAEMFEQLAALCIDPEQVKELEHKVTTLLKQPERPALSMMERAELEDELNMQLESYQIADYCLVETLADGGFQPEEIAAVTDLVPPESVETVLGWVNHQLNVRKTVKDIKEASERISGLVTAIKGFSHMDQGTDKQAVDIHAGLENTLTIMEYKLRKAKVEVTREFDPELPRVMAVVGEMNQVWTNIIDNAIDAMEANGNGKLTIKTGKDARNVYVQISDNGPGIPEDIQTRIYDPFFTTKEVGKGTGLGLDVVMRIVTQHRGAIKLKTSDQGTTFFICLPVQDNLNQHLSV